MAIKPANGHPGGFLWAGQLMSSPLDPAVALEMTKATARWQKRVRRLAGGPSWPYPVGLVVGILGGALVGSGLAGVAGAAFGGSIGALLGLVVAGAVLRIFLRFTHVDPADYPPAPPSPGARVVPQVVADSAPREASAEELYRWSSVVGNYDAAVRAASLDYPLVTDNGEPEVAKQKAEWRAQLADLRPGYLAVAAELGFEPIPEPKFT